MSNLRPYQGEAIECIKCEVAAGKRRILLAAATGSGKTVIAAAAIAEDRDAVLFVAHRRELIEQTSSKLYDVGVDHGIIQAGFSPRPSQRVQIASIQTLHARAGRTRKIDLPPAALLIFDEAHHVRARTYMWLVKAYPDAIVLGLTATPCRAAGRGLGNVFQSLVECPSVAEPTDAGYLVPAEILSDHKKLNGGAP
jgi:superfamily II DNA or RNA helicase